MDKNHGVDYSLGVEYDDTVMYVHWILKSNGIKWTWLYEKHIWMAFSNETKANDSNTFLRLDRTFVPHGQGDGRS